MTDGIAVMKKEPEEAKSSTSMFMITINPNRRFKDITTPEAKELFVRLRLLGNMLLKKKSIKSSIMFFDKPDKKTGITTKIDREMHMSKIIEISPDRTGQTEWGSRDFKPHLHIEFSIKHRTFLQLNRDYYVRIAAAICKVPEKSIHVHISGATKQAGYKKYLAVGGAEDAKHFMDDSAQSFSFTSTEKSNE